MTKIRWIWAGAFWIGCCGPSSAATTEQRLAVSVVTVQAVSEAVQTLQAMARKAVADKAAPGLAIAVVFQDTLVWAGGFGVRDVTTGRPVDADTVFQLASVSKPLASTVVAELVGEGRIAWDTRISDLDPDFQLADPWVTREVRINDLFSHRAGLPDHAGDLLEDMGYSRAEILRRLRYQKGGGPFRASYAYTNFGLTEAALAAVKPYGQTWEDVSQSRLYRPLGMTSTSSRYSDFVGRQDRAVGHVKVNGRWVAKYQRAPDAQSPAGGASSSANDLAKWMRLQLADGGFEGRQVVDAVALAETHAPQIRSGSNPLTGAPQFYGLGWNVSYDPEGRLRLGHSGAFSMGASTVVSLVPSQHLGIVVLVNAEPAGVPEALAACFLDQALYGVQTQDWPALFEKAFAAMAGRGVDRAVDHAKPPTAPSPALADAAYLGAYSNAYFGDVEVVDRGGALAIVEGPGRMTFPLIHQNRDTFAYPTTGENASGPAGVTFAVGPDGRARSLTVSNLNDNGDGVFARKGQ
jgi:CubicO group peptidase (beta-lactamase class C family)